MTSFIGSSYFSVCTVKEDKRNNGYSAVQSCALDWENMTFLSLWFDRQGQVVCHANPAVAKTFRLRKVGMPSRCHSPYGLLICKHQYDNPKNTQGQSCALPTRLPRRTTSMMNFLLRESSSEYPPYDYTFRSLRVRPRFRQLREVLISYTIIHEKGGFCQW